MAQITNKGSDFVQIQSVKHGGRGGPIITKSPLTIQQEANWAKAYIQNKTKTPVGWGGPNVKQNYEGAMRDVVKSDIVSTYGTRQDLLRALTPNQKEENIKLLYQMTGNYGAARELERQGVVVLPQYQPGPAAPELREQVRQQEAVVRETEKFTPKTETSASVPAFVLNLPVVKDIIAERMKPPAQQTTTKPRPWGQLIAPQSREGYYTPVPTQERMTTTLQDYKARIKNAILNKEGWQVRNDLRFNMLTGELEEKPPGYGVIGLAKFGQEKIGGIGEFAGGIFADIGEPIAFGKRTYVPTSGVGIMGVDPYTRPEIPQTPKQRFLRKERIKTLGYGVAQELPYFISKVRVLKAGIDVAASYGKPDWGKDIAWGAIMEGGFRVIGATSKLAALRLNRQLGGELIRIGKGKEAIWAIENPMVRRIETAMELTGKYGLPTYFGYKTLVANQPAVAALRANQFKTSKRMFREVGESFGQITAGATISGPIVGRALKTPVDKWIFYETGLQMVKGPEQKRLWREAFKEIYDFKGSQALLKNLDFSQLKAVKGNKKLAKIIERTMLSAKKDFFLIGSLPQYAQTIGKLPARGKYSIGDIDAKFYSESAARTTALKLFNALKRQRYNVKLIEKKGEILIRYEGEVILNAKWELAETLQGWSEVADTFPEKQLIKTPKGINMIDFRLQAKRKLVGYTIGGRADKDFPDIFAKGGILDTIKSVKKSQKGYVSPYTKLPSVNFELGLKGYPATISSTYTTMKARFKTEKAFTEKYLGQKKTETIKLSYPSKPSEFKFPKYPTFKPIKPTTYPTYTSPGKPPGYPNITTNQPPTYPSYTPIRKPSKYPLKFTTTEIPKPKIPKYPVYEIPPQIPKVLNKLKKDSSLSQEKKKQLGYNIILRDMGKKTKTGWKPGPLIQVNKKPLDRESAKRVMHNLLDNSIAQSGIIVPTKQKAMYGVNLPSLDNKFYLSRKHPGLSIEKRINAIDTIGEKKEIKAAKLLKQISSPILFKSPKKLKATKWRFF